MNKQELIEKYKELENSSFDIAAIVVCQLILKDLEQLDEPKPVKVQQFVADFIAEQKKLGHTLSYSIDASMSDIVAEWYWDNSELFALAWIFGYEVEEEKRYTVVTKATKQPLYYNAMDKKLFFSMGGLATKFTRKQLKEADLGWVFDCEGIEIEEVE
ncbi:TPA: DUF1642 domain-containing protein [Streptococcus pneumoniae]|uniref:Phage protein n=2 Tax=Streptococcus pneumoniae TaxID=1313 RepID=A0A822RBU5_STREE|nr:hypothetical protein SpnNT_01604 [Streptococcus pneumoniae]EPD19538.1 hypothetical protein SP6UMMC_06217 [Streptococcus pneumoniae MNZ41]ETE02983.1 hypothetical protein U756_01390 [Streptococcus pneumoniae 27]ETE18283.1 hypothetical protein U754_00820 [Streptococcus pneumoniae 13856]ETE28085.1 hypothetical protein U755_00295 [Streptococcus pneumoniae 1719]